jgi:hypothetical protein
MDKSFFQDLMRAHYPEGKRIGSWVVEDSSLAYEDKWIGLANIKLKSKRDKSITYTVLLMKPSIAVLAITEKHEVILIRQPRIGSGLSSDWELPQEIADETDFANGAIRGAKEEFGLLSYSKIEKIPLKIYSNPARTTEQNYGFIVYVKGFDFAKRTDKEEAGEMKLVNLESLNKLIRDSEIVDSVSLAILNWLLANPGMIQCKP